MKLDFLIRDAAVVNVLSGEIIRRDVGVKNGLIAGIGPDGPDTGPETEIIEARGDYLCPGLFDVHAHPDWFANPAAASDAFLSRGVTGILADNHDCAAALGPGGYEELLTASRKFNLRYFAGVPAATPPYPAVEGPEIIPFEDFKRILSRPEVLAISEIMSWPSILQGDPRLLDRINLARALNKRVEGHTLGASAEKLKILARAGITSCHESLSAADVQNRLEAGLWVMVRDSSIRSDLDKIIPYVAGLAPEQKDKICLVTDARFPGDFQERGGLENVLARAVEFGLDPLEAMKMATYNPARYLGLDSVLGQVKPGLAADLILVGDLERPVARLVMAKGKTAAIDGRLVIDPSTMPRTIAGDRPYGPGLMKPEDFELKSGAGFRSGEIQRLPVIKIVDPTVTRAGEVNLTADNGHLNIPEDGDLMRAAPDLPGRPVSGAGPGVRIRFSPWGPGLLHCPRTP